MSKKYEQADEDVMDLVAEVLDKDYHKDLRTAGVTVGCLMCWSTDGPAIMHHGAPALAVIKINNLQSRLQGLPDATITIDANIWEDRLDTGSKRLALIDHELTHLLVQWNDEGKPKLDNASRPKLKMRSHDYEFGWFVDVARRHGYNSPEVIQAQIMMEENGQTFWPSLMESAENARQANVMREVDEALERHDARDARDAAANAVSKSREFSLHIGPKEAGVIKEAIKKAKKKRAGKKV